MLCFYITMEVEAELLIANCLLGPLGLVVKVARVVREVQGEPGAPAAQQAAAIIRGGLAAPAAPEETAAEVEMVHRVSACHYQKLVEHP